MPGRFCPSCGYDAHAPARIAGAGPSEPVPPSAGTGRSRWLPAALVAGAVVAVLAVVAALLIALTGSGSTPATKKIAPVRALEAVKLAGQPLYAPQSADAFVVFTPAGWAPGRFAAPIPLQSQVTARSPQDRDTSVSVGEIVRRGALAAQAKAIAKRLATKAGYQRGESQPTTFPGGAPAWRMSYQLAGSAQLMYLVDYCHRRFAVIGAASPAKADQVKQRFGLTASTLQVTC